MNHCPSNPVPFILAFFLAMSFAPAAHGQSADFGDAPDQTGYATTLSKNGARHTIMPGFYLGLRVDAETDGQPTVAADGDDTRGDYDDEDGVRFLSELTPGATASVAIIASQPGFVSAWIDFEANKSWAEAGNRVITTAAVTAGVNRVTFLVPAGATPGTTYARFRLSKQGVSVYYGPATDGEVEDHRVMIRSVDFGDCQDVLRRPAATRLAAAAGGTNDYAGWSVATDGEWLVAGAHKMGTGGEYGGPGGAYVFRWNGLEWVEFQKLVASDGMPDEGVGWSAVLRGDWMMIGARDHTVGAVWQAGAVYVFRWNGSQWTETQILTADDAEPLGGFGVSLSMAGTRAVVGAYWTALTGAAYVFKLDGTNWVQEARLTPFDGQSWDHFGQSVALDGASMLVGSSSSAYYFEESGGVWSEKEKLVVPEGQTWAGFGKSVALASGRAAIGAPYAAYSVYSDATNAGVVYCYKLTGLGWSLIQTQRHHNIYDTVRYGYSLAMRGDYLAVSAPAVRDAIDSYCGLVELFAWTGTSWQDTASFYGEPGVSGLGKALDLGDQWLAAGAPETPYGPANSGEAYAFDLAPYPYNYPTLYVNDGARHVIDPAVRLGEKYDAEPDAYASSDALGDDAHDADDEDGISFITTLFPGRDATIAAYPSVSGFLSGWIDFNDDGDWDDAHEIVALGLPVAAGVTNVTFLVAPDAAPREQGGRLFARFRFSTGQVLTPGGEAKDGEVEDYTVSVERFPDQMDFGDAPDSGVFAYRTLLANHGAWHEIKTNAPWMGGTPDDDTNGLPNVDAKGDDVTGTGDEDGVAFPTRFVRGMEAFIKVDCSTSPRAGYLNGWIDYNRNGRWDDAGEHIIVDHAISAGQSYRWSGTVPTAALVGPTYARFRICSAPGLPSYGPAVDGEVEDYALEILQTAPTADIMITNIQHSTVHRMSDVAWTAEPGILYQLQSTTNLPSLSGAWWTDVGGLVLGPVNWQQDTNALGPKGFYRVVAPWVGSP